MQFAHGRTASVVAGASVLVLLGGVGGAVAANTVGSQDIRNNSVRQVDVKDGGLGFRDFNDWTQNRIDAANRGQRGPRGFQGETGPQGPKGDTGPAGPAGPAGADGVSGYLLQNAEVRWAPGGSSETIASCPDGKVALSGGYEIDGTANGSAAETEIVDDGPVFVALDDASGWRVAGVPSGEVNVKAWVICADVS